jgi:transposase
MAGSVLLKQRPAARILHGDKGYDSNAIRRQVEENGTMPNIPPKANRRYKNCFSPVLYRDRNAIERMCQSAWNWGSDSISLQVERLLTLLFQKGDSAMDRSMPSSRLVPRGFIVERFDVLSDRITASVRSAQTYAHCPCCGTVSRRVQSRYRRRASDLPIAGRCVDLAVTVRRFRCDGVLCGRRILAERFGDEVLASHSRRTSRLEQIVHHLGLALGGRPAASMAQRLMLPVSNDTLLRVVRRRAREPDERLTVIGIDDFAWRRNHHYGTIVCDLKRRRPVVLLKDREQATAEDWLKDRPSIAIVARDRGGGYGEAMARALPHAVQVADRWHLMENASRAFLDAVRASMRPIRAAVGATVINPALLTSAERLQYEGYLRREETNDAIMAQIKAGVPLRRIAKNTGHSRRVVRAVARGERSDVFRTSESSLELYLPWLNAQWDSGARNATALWRKLQDRRGFRGSLRVIGEWATRRRRAEKASAETLTRVPSARTIVRLMTISRDNLTKAESVVVAAVEGSVPAVVEARETIADFHAMVRKKDDADLGSWIDRALGGLVATFGRGVVKDEAAVRAAIMLPWSNGQTEGQITKLKLVKRQMYGRGKLDLLQARLIGASPC